MPDRTNSIGIDDHEGPMTMSWAERLAVWLGAGSRHIALLAACLATGGSLFMSEVLGWQPCLLCWYQRIFMYPLALILPIGIIRRDRGLHLYVLPLALLGAPISLYHYLLIKTNLFPPPPCTVGAPCTVDYIDWLGFINIPFMALTAFLIISVTMGASALLAEPDGLDTRDDGAGEGGGESEEGAAGLGMSGIAVFAIIALVLVVYIAASALIG